MAKKIIKKTINKDLPSDGVYPILPLRDVVIVPNMIFPVLIGREQSLNAITAGIEAGNVIFLVTQIDSSIENPTHSDIYEFGTLSKIVQVLRLPNKMLKVLVEGTQHARITKATEQEKYLEGSIKVVKQESIPQNPEFTTLVMKLNELFTTYVKLSSNLPDEVATTLDNIEDEYNRLFYMIANIDASAEQKQKILNLTSLEEQYIHLTSLLTTELDLHNLEAEIDMKVNETIQKSQRKYFIQEQIRTLQKELGDDDESDSDILLLRKAIEDAKMPEHALLKANEEIDRLKKTSPMSPEYGVSRSYIEWLASIPWSVKTPDNLDISHANEVLNIDHYGLEKPKERILEYISVLNLSSTSRGQILCLVGPPGVGKTSLASSIARALGRKFIRISLGGVRDEAEIRGHRKTYIGSMPGKIIQTMKRAGTINPVILLDEVDKMSSDFRGDPSAALLEVLDPEQNHTFSDHFIEIEYDLSNVLFIATANVKYDIPLPLLDRMEVIELSSYLDNDKLEIAKRHIVPKQKNALGLDEIPIEITDDALNKIITEHTRESGVRQMEREISTVFRKIATKVVTDVGKKISHHQITTTKPTTTLFKESKEFVTYAKKNSFVVDSTMIDTLLKSPKYKAKPTNITDKVGVVTGLAWTSVGGDTLPVEVSILPGSDKLTLTGKLGDVMKESAQAALSYVRANHALFNLQEDFAKGKEIHIHVPEGAIPKDGPSAGITMTMALISAATGNIVRGDVAMTGEVTLRGNILPIGGLNEKLLAAKRHGATAVIVPKENQRDVEDLHEQITEGLIIHFVSTIQEALPFVFRDSTVKIPNERTQVKQLTTRPVQKVRQNKQS